MLPKPPKRTIGDVLVKLEYATSEEVAQALAKFHKIP